MATDVGSLFESTANVSLISVRSLSKHFPVRRGVLQTVRAWVRAVDDVSFDIESGRTVGLVGESGCGKTTVGRTLLKLLPATSGRIVYRGIDITSLTRNQMQLFRREMQIVFQDPVGSLNPRMTVGNTIGEALVARGGFRGARRRERIDLLLETVGLPRDAALRYPHEFSGGQRQRIGIARALAVEPALIVCDEPVSALDVSVQAQIINLLMDLQEKFGVSYLFIAHDLSVVRHVSHEVIVMYLGHIMERASTEQLFESPLHPYTRLLLAAMPVPDPDADPPRALLKGDVPSPTDVPPWCRFFNRCPEASPACREGVPLKEVAPGHFVRCVKR